MSADHFRDATKKVAMSAEPVAVSPCGWRWLDSWIFRRRVPSYSTPSEWGPVYDRATLDAAVAAARAEERAARDLDAERYRWLRDSEWDCFDSSWLVAQDVYGQSPDDLDALIDAAIRDLKPEGE